ncbi:MAG TPA: RdgB/HAM1 family non-canonical purine NTP pyrophosphatase [Nitrospirae bacterium]|nr:RdgB/HAM1 family non-canonical purine NTP pyrophosphatase [Nitrospirota bacterium]
MVKILLATGNKGKIKEMNALFSDMDIEFIGTDTLKETPEVVEDGKTYHDNALKKAMTFYKIALIPTLAEDSGLEVDALHGAPGVYSARIAGEGAPDAEKVRKLLEMMKDVPDERRTARFVSVLCLVLDGKPYFFEGQVRGHITRRPSGRSGFGFDPVFVPEGYKRTFASLGQKTKNRISHRARAIEKLKEFLKERLTRS